MMKPLQLDAFDRETFATPTRTLRGMTRGHDAIESQRAAADVLPKLTEIQRKIMDILASAGPLNATDLERRVEFRNLAPSTCRKRISELKQLGKLVQVGRKDRMALWDIPSRSPALQVSCSEEQQEKGKQEQSEAA